MTGFPLGQPLATASMKMWLDAPSLALANNDPVASWTDMSGLGNHAVQASATLKPLFKINILNGLPMLLFDGGNDFMAFPSGCDLTNQCTVFVVGYSPALIGAGTSQHIFVVQDNLGNEGVWMSVLSLSASVDALWWWGYDAAAYQYSQFAPLDQLNATNRKFVVCGTYDATSAEIWVNGGINLTDTAVAVNISAVVRRAIGSNGAGTANFYSGYLGEVILFNAKLTNTEIDGWNNYLLKKWLPAFAR
jgi:hypothetical protein